MRFPIIRLVVTATVLFLGLSTQVAQASQPKLSEMNCEELLKEFPNGIASNAAVAKRTGSTLNKTLYAKYRRLDGNQNGALCEQFGGVGAACNGASVGWTRTDWYGPPNLLTCIKSTKKTGWRNYWVKASPGAVAITWDCFVSKKCGEQTPAAPVSVSFRYAWGYLSIQQVATPAADQCIFVPVTFDIRGPSSVIQLYLRDEYRNLLSMLDFSQISRELGVKQYSMQVCGYKWTANTDPLQRVAVGMPVKWCKAYLVPENDSPTSLFTQFTGNCSS